jgi:O-antigen ligase
LINNFITNDGELKPLQLSLLIGLFYAIILTILLIVKPSFFVYAIIVIPLFGLSLIILFTRIEFAILAYIATIPIIQHFSLISVPLGGFRITPDMVIHILILIALLNEVVFSFNPNKPKYLTGVDKALLVFVLLTFFSIIAASSQPIDHGKRILLYYTGIFQPISFYFILIHLLSKDKLFSKNLIVAITLTSLSASVIAFLELKEVGLNLIGIFLRRNEIGFGYRNTNLFGIHAALLFPIFFYAIHSKAFAKIKFIIWLNFILLSLLSFLTLNRGTFLILAVYLFILFWKKENRKIVLGFIVSGLVAAAYFSNLLIIYINRFLGGNATQTGFLGDESALFRIQIWKLGFETILKNPFGIGGTGFIDVWKKYGIDQSWTFVTPHQILLYIGVDYGLPALIAFIFLFVVLFKSLSYLSKNSEQKNTNLFYYVRLSLIGYLIHGFLTGGELSHLSGNIYPNNGYSYILMILLALVSVELTNRRIIKK